MMDLAFARCAGMDISKTDAKVCVRIQQEGKRRATSTVTVWGATSSQILALGEYLVAQRVTRVVMEATGDYWKPFYFLLGECGLDVLLVNPRSVKQIPGRKTDVADATWLAELAAHDLVRGSFVLPAPIRELQDLVRCRTLLVRSRGQEAQRLEKLLESAAIKLSSVISDILGASGRRFLDALVHGVRDPVVLAGLGDKRLKAAPEQLAEALTGRFTDHHAFLVTLHLKQIDHFTSQISAVDERIDAYFDPGASNPPASRVPVEVRSDLAVKRQLLRGIPGIEKTVAERILAEIGPDMSAFPTAAQLVSWAGLAPGANESAGKVKSARRRPGNTHLQGALGIAAMNQSRSRKTFFGARYRRVRSRRGHARALVAVEHSMLAAIWHVLTSGEHYQDLGFDYYTRRKPAKAIRKAIQQLRDAGCTVTLQTPHRIQIT